MKSITLKICAACLLLCSCNNAAKNESAPGDTAAAAAKEAATTNENVQTAAKEEKWIPIDSATNMKAMMDYGKIGAPQEMLAKSTGRWKGVTVFWMEDGSKPDTFVADVVNKMVMGKHFLVTNYSGNMMGMPFEGQSTMGYDNAKKMYTSSWIDNMSSGIMSMEGPWDEATKTITLKGKVVNPANGLPCELKQTYKIVDDNHHLLEMYSPDPKTGKPYKNMELTLTRKS